MRHSNGEELQDSMKIYATNVLFINSNNLQPFAQLLGFQATAQGDTSKCQ